MPKIIVTFDVVSWSKRDHGSEKDLVDDIHENLCLLIHEGKEEAQQYLKEVVTNIGPVYIADWMEE